MLKAAGFVFDVIPADVDEVIDAEETPDGYVRRVAQLKAQAVAARAPGQPILGADTIVIIDHQVLGKPASEDDAKRMLRLLSGREHVVMTAVCLMNQAGPASAFARSGRSATRLASADWRSAPRTAPADKEAGHDGHEGESKRFQTSVARTTVEFAALSDQEIEWYVSTGEPTDKAGAYAVQGLASRFVTRIDGSYSNVVGLPVALVYNLCKRAGLLVS